MAEMTSRERLLAAIRHQDLDRVPVAPRMMHWGAGRHGVYTWLQQLSTQAEFGDDLLVDLNFELPDYVARPFSGDYRDLDQVRVEISVENEDELQIIRRQVHTPAGDMSDEIAMGHRRSKYGQSPSPTLRKPLVKSVADVDKLRYLLADPRQIIETNYREIRDVVGERGLIQVHPKMMMSGMTAAMGMAETMVAYYEDRSLFDCLLQLYGEYAQEITKAICELGAEIVFMSWHNFGFSGGWSPRIFRAAFKPWVKANVDLVHGYGLIYNYFDNGKMMPIIEDIAECGPDIISTLCPPPVADVDLAKVKQLVGDKVCLNGNVDGIYVVQQGTKEQIREAVREAIRVAAPGSGFILGDSDCFFWETSVENIRAFYEAAREFGRYPLNL